MLDKTKVRPYRIKNHSCPCCGHPIDAALGVSGRPLFGPVQQSLFNAIKKCPDGISVADLHDRVYGARDRCIKLIPTTVACINKKLTQFGLKIKSTGGPGSTYFLIQI